VLNVIGRARLGQGLVKRRDAGIGILDKVAEECRPILLSGEPGPERRPAVIFDDAVPERQCNIGIPEVAQGTSELETTEVLGYSENPSLKKVTIGGIVVPVDQVLKFVGERREGRCSFGAGR